MQKREKSFLLTTETHEVTIIRAGRAVRDRGYCRLCGDDVKLISFDVAMGLSGLTGRGLGRRIREGDVHLVEGVHFFEITRGQMFVCGESLFDLLNK